MPYRIEATKAAERDLEKIAKKDRTGTLQVKKAILSLAVDPHPPGSKKLAGQSPELYRVRSGDYRILYQVEEEEILILLVKVGDRKDVYRYLKRK